MKGPRWRTRATWRTEDAESRGSFWGECTAARTSTASHGGSRCPSCPSGWSTRPAGDGEPIIDVRAGWSTLVDHLLERGYRDLTAIDLSATALATARFRISEASKAVVLDVADALDFHPGRLFALWYDRAVFHFLELDERDDYRASLDRCL